MDKLQNLYQQTQQIAQGLQDLQNEQQGQQQQQVQQNFDPKGEKRCIVAVRYYGSAINQYKLDDGTVIDKPQAIDMVNAGLLPGLAVGVARDGSEYVRDNARGGDQITNLADLPQF